jgi:glycosyltransferase involved in cell wall biosynthesis
MRRRDEMVANLRAAMESLASDSARCRTMSAAGVARVRDHFTWSAKADRIAAIYRDIV